MQRDENRLAIDRWENEGGRSLLPGGRSLTEDCELETTALDSGERVTPLGAAEVRPGSAPSAHASESMIHGCRWSSESVSRTPPRVQKLVSGPNRLNQPGNRIGADSAAVIALDSLNGQRQ